MPTLLLVRHGQASFGGPDYDVLSADGLAQSAALARELVSRKLTVDRVVSGSLRRRLVTADPSAAALGCMVTVDPRWTIGRANLDGTRVAFRPDRCKPCSAAWADLVGWKAPALVEALLRDSMPRAGAVQA
jgi:hypothetical protein